MKYVGHHWLTADDLAILQKMGKNTALSSYGWLSDQIHLIIPRYIQYKFSGGNAWSLSAPLSLTPQLKKALVLHYENRIQELDFISKILDSCKDACPLCGSTLPATEIDHVIPKEAYPEFACLSLNLVAACKCNGWKGVKYKGSANFERVLHPYFDKILVQRLIYISFNRILGKLTLEIEIMPAHSENMALKYHVDNILKKTKCLKKAENLWGVFSDAPGLNLYILPRDRQCMSKTDFKETIECALEANDKSHRTPNNWESMFYYGILQSPYDIDLAYNRLLAGY